MFHYMFLCNTLIPDPAIAAIMHAISCHSKQWHTVELDIPLICFEYLEGVKHRLPNLQRLIIDKRLWPGPQLQPSSVDVFSVALQLWNVTILGSTRHPPAIQLPTTTLTKLFVECACAQACLAVLRQYPQVINCTFDGIVVGFGTSEVFVSQLTSLDIGVHNEYDENMSTIFNPLTLPAI